MTTRDMLQILIKGQDSLQKGFDSLQKGFGSLEKRVDSLQKGFGSLEKRVDSLQKGFGLLEKRVDLLQKGQNELKEELAVLREETRDGFRETHERLDKQGKQLAYLEDDAPTREEHDGLVKKVEKIEKVLSS